MLTILIRKIDLNAIGKYYCTQITNIFDHRSIITYSYVRVQHLFTKTYVVMKIKKKEKQNNIFKIPTNTYIQKHVSRTRTNNNTRFKKNQWFDSLKRKTERKLIKVYLIIFPPFSYRFSSVNF